MNLLKLSALISNTLKSYHQCRRLNPHSHLSKRTIHTDQRSENPNDKHSTTVKAICHFFRLGSNWDVLSKKFHDLNLDETLVEKVLVELKQPIDAKRALGFFHWSAKRKSFEHGLRSYSIAIHILVKARMNLDAKALIESVLKRNNGKDSFSKFSVVDSLLDTYWIAGSNPFVFDLLVRCYSKLRMLELGFEVCCYLQERGICLNLRSLNRLLLVVEISGESVGFAWKIYEHMVGVRVYGDEVTVRRLIGCLCKEGKLKKRIEMLDRICGKRCSNPFVLVNTTLVFGMLEQGKVEEGMALLKRLLMKNMVFDTIAYSLIVYAKIRLGDLGGAREAFEEMLKRGFQTNSFVQTSFIEAYCDEGRVDEAGSLLEDMENAGLKPYDETFNCLVKGNARAGRLEESLRCCERMLEKGFIPTCSAFNEMVEGLSENGDVEKANSMLTLLLDRGFDPNEVTYARLIDGYGKRGNLEEVLKLYYEMQSKSLSPGSSVFYTVIKSLCGAGRLEDAEKYLGVMVSRSIVGERESLYETLIACYVTKGDMARAARLRNRIALVRNL